MEKIITWRGSEKVELTVGQDVLLGKCGSGRSVFYAKGKFTKVTKQHLVFTAENGRVIKCSKDNMYRNTPSSEGVMIIVDVEKANNPEWIHSFI